MKDEVKATGQLKIKLHSPDGTIKETRTVKNLVVNMGKEFIASRMLGATLTPMSHMAIGSGVVASAATDTTLGAEMVRISLTSSSVLARTLTFIATYSAGVGTGPITEAGLFNSSGGGTMLARTTFDVFNKQATDLLTIEWDVTIN